MCDFYDEDDWSLSDEDVSETVCHHCDEKKLCRYTRDPYRAEINPEDDNPKSNWCYRCWDTRKDDI